MPKFELTFDDKTTIEVHAASEAAAKKHADKTSDKEVKSVKKIKD